MQSLTGFGLPELEHPKNLSAKIPFIELENSGQQCHLNMQVGVHLRNTNQIRESMKTAMTKFLVLKHAYPELRLSMYIKCVPWPQRPTGPEGIGFELGRGPSKASGLHIWETVFYGMACACSYMLEPSLCPQHVQFTSKGIGEGFEEKEQGEGVWTCLLRDSIFCGLKPICLGLSMDIIDGFWCCCQATFVRAPIHRQHVIEHVL